MGASLTDYESFDLEAVHEGEECCIILQTPEEQAIEGVSFWTIYGRKLNPATGGLEAEALVDIIDAEQADTIYRMLVRGLYEYKQGPAYGKGGL